jgi:hypothetical protein|tara:strand:- start:276 stop:494 length:219 start_codon:yes stop_codon:yes gene_type:complete
MTLEELQQIKFETKRFSDTIDEAITLAKNTPGWPSYKGDGTMVGKHDISSTRMAGAVKRRALDLKYYLTKKL